jgi:hypothetical protein
MYRKLPELGTTELAATSLLFKHVQNNSHPFHTLTNVTHPPNTQTWSGPTSLKNSKVYLETF